MLFNIQILLSLELDVVAIIPTSSCNRKEIVKLLCSSRLGHHVGNRFSPLQIMCGFLVRRRCRFILVDFDEHKLRVILLVLQDVKPSNAGLECRIASILQRGLFEGKLCSRFGLDRDVNCSPLN
jgi:hypothetical protein